MAGIKKSGIETADLHVNGLTCLCRSCTIEALYIIKLRLFHNQLKTPRSSFKLILPAPQVSAKVQSNYLHAIIRKKLQKSSNRLLCFFLMSAVTPYTLPPRVRDAYCVMLLMHFGPPLLA